MANETMVKFGYPASLIREYAHWVVLLRPAQVTLGSLVLASKSEAQAFGDLSPDAYAELAVVTREIEETLRSQVAFEKINYLMLMMVDPYVHFHVLPRYSGPRSMNGVTIRDAGWPGQPDLKSAPPLEPSELALLHQQLTDSWSAIS